jgi:hypothetical protein
VPNGETPVTADQIGASGADVPAYAPALADALGPSDGQAFLDEALARVPDVTADGRPCSRRGSTSPPRSPASVATARA